MGEIEFDISKVEKTNETVEETFKRWDVEFRKNHPIKQWVNDLFKGSLFSYAPWYALSHPHVLFMDLMREIKWAYQRVSRGWDDRAVWGVDWWLNHILPDILFQLKTHKQGTPMKFYEGLEHDENYCYSEESDNIAQERWNKELDKMIAAFQIAKQIDDCVYTLEQEKELEKIVEEGMLSFVKNYRGLWD